ncbi:ATP-binding protein [Dictyobacter kobayashii]|uniref:ATP-binding protein n=1 Tax=Dictyobacter kobayashii TaxID=2014872 RepID=A0A402AT53_9CHLR|nr:SbcC/MukB-like Walker B domain-containing protein [Dictyobacter kobayashii]GCE22223.1 ATP-binding protein [Dictyobacter kobayashii]
MEPLSLKPQMLDIGTSMTGFRLMQLEVYNWGTFNQRVWKMSPGGGTALLTGANASGKSTLVDALLTLLVPYNRRTYNQASGTEKHRERDERTYILGAWSKQKDSGSSQARPEYLRDKTSYSVLLAVFHNDQSRRDVTLAQVLRVQDDGISKFFVVAPLALTIVEHFRLTGTLTELRKQLRASGAEVYNEFAAYSRQIRHLMNVRSEKAFDLFNQIVSMKEIGGLNTFVRDHMLEKTDIQHRIAQLHANFENLTRSHDAILLAQKQLDILRPLCDEANKYVELQIRISEAQRCIDLVPFYIIKSKLNLLEGALATAELKREDLQDQLSGVSERLKDLKQQEIDLHVALSNNQIGQQIARLNLQLNHRLSEQRSKEKETHRYNALAESLGLAGYRDKTTFYATIQQAKSFLDQMNAELEEFKDERDTVMQQLTTTKGISESLYDEITSLRERKSQIPNLDIAIRRQLAIDLHIVEDELPFIGELLRVRENEQLWEAATERLLHHFALQVLVPEQWYHQVSRFVEKTHLGRRFVYHRVAVGQRTPRNTNLPYHNMLYNKLEIKAGTAFSDWLAAEIIDRYDYLCCETLEEFQQARRALTVKGQIKHSAVLHEKDDRQQLGDRTFYVLGWNNKEKLVVLEKQLAKQKEDFSRLQAAVANLEKHQKQGQGKQQGLQRFLEFEHFTTIDWRTEEQAVLALQAQIQDLEKNSSLAELRRQLKGVEEELSSGQENYNHLNGSIATFQHDIETYTNQQEQCHKTYKKLGSERAAQLAHLEKEHGSKELTLETVDKEESVLTMFYTRRINSLQGTLNPLGPQMVLRMQELRGTSAKIAQEVDTSLEAIDQYKQYYEQIKREDLPRHSKRFKELLNDNVIIDINSFKAGLEQQEKEIEESIEKLNRSLGRIDYTPLTYIQLCCERTHDQQVRDFKMELRACLPDVSQQRTPEANEVSFQRIHALLQRFQQEERWTTKVTDVRNWLDFSAEELYREDGKRKNYYSDSSGKSGGQKTKLAYTILASAIAYQYGLDQEEGHERTFRFVVVDEAFSKSDEMNARYAMELFKQLELQLLVVTPLDKIHVIEPYISACHYVVNTEEENDSKVYNLSIEQYYQQKREIEMGVMISDYAD